MTVGIAFRTLIAASSMEVAMEVAYFLRATWDSASDQGYNDGQVLDSAGEGVEAGELTVVENDGTLAVSSNAMTITEQSSPSSGDLGVYSHLIEHFTGLALKAKVNLSDANNYGLAWKNDNSVNITGGAGNRFAFRASNDRFSMAGGTAGNSVISLLSISDSTEYELALVLGGYNSDIEPLQSGQDGDLFPFGSSFFIKGGSFTNWTRVFTYPFEWWTDPRAVFANNTADGIVDDMLVPNADISSVLVPKKLSLFTDSNGTGLDSYTPDIGGGWTEESGAWEIQGNRAESTSAGIATFDSELSDLWIEALVYVENDTTTRAGLIFRFSDTDNYVSVEINPGNNNISLRKTVSGSDSSLASASATFSVGGSPYHIAVMANGADQFVIYIDGEEALEYSTTETHNQNETEVGILDDGTGILSFDNITVRPFDDGSYDNVLDLTSPSALYSGAVSDLSDDFDDNNINHNQWSRFLNSAGTGAFISETGGEMKFEVSSAGSGGLKLHTANKYKLSGDFDIQVDVDIQSDGGDYLAGLILADHVPNIDAPGKPDEEIRTVFDASNLGGEIRTGGSPALLDGTGSYIARPGTTLRIKVTRSSTTATCEYWDGDSWEVLESGTIGTDDMTITLWLGFSSTSSAFDIRWDDLVVNSGSVVQG